MHDTEQKTINNKQDHVLSCAEKYAHEIYAIAKLLPKDEIFFGLTSQLRRAALSVPLNIVEGYARQLVKSEIQFLKIAYGSLKESLFIIKFAQDESYVTSRQIVQAQTLGQEAARLIWSKAKSLEKKLP